MATLSSTRVPIKVQHNNNNNNENYYYRTTSTIHSSPPQPPQFTSVYDEPEGIKKRMKEFEERCKKWREDFFARNGSNIHNISTFNEFDTKLPPPPPPPPPSSYLAGGTPFSTQNDSLLLNQSPFRSSPFTSTLHKSYVEDGRDGKKVYKVEFEIGDFKENELNITTQGNLLLIKGDREIKVGSSTEKKTFNREITLPDYVNINNLNAYLTGPTLTVEVPINDDTYYQRRSTLNSVSSTPLNSARSTYSSPLKQQQSTSQVHSSTSSTSHYSTTKSSSTNNNNNNLASPSKNQSYLISLSQPSKPAEVVSGYPIFSKDENCTIYKFDLSGFTQSDINLSITEKKTLEIKASKEINDNIGKSYREFKREIQLGDNVDLNSISNSLSNDGILTLKIPYLQQNIDNNNNNILSNASVDQPDIYRCEEQFTKSGKLVKLVYDFKGFEPEHLKILLTTTNELKLTATITDSANPNRVIKQTTRQYQLPSYIKPEQMKAVMSRNGSLAIDFTCQQLSEQFDTKLNLKS